MRLRPSRHNAAAGFITGEEVATVVESKESGWRYKDPQLDGVVDRISLGIDGTTILFCDDGYREAMVGTISLYNCVGRRLHTIYVGAEPEYGKQRFYERMEKEIAIYKDRYPLAHWVGVAGNRSQGGILK